MKERALSGLELAQNDLATAQDFARWLGDQANRLGDEVWEDTLEPVADWVGDAADRFADAIQDQMRRLVDPIVLDLNGDGIELLPRVTANVYFDMDGDGRRELTGWVGPDDALLVVDADRDGKVASIDELVGDLGRSGFSELATYDANGDRVIDAADAIWGDLKVWRDANTNATVDAGEMVTAETAGLRAIDLRYTTVNFTAEGNRIHEQSTFEWADGRTGLAVDAWFDVDNVVTARDASETGNSSIDALPDIPGNGDLASLRVAMLADGALTSLVSGIVGRLPNQLDGVRTAVEQILYRWAGVQDVDPAARGGLIDARALGTLERMLGTPFVANGVTDPNAQSIGSLNRAWTSLVDGTTARLLLSGPLGNVLDGALYSSIVDRLLTVQTPADFMAQLGTAAPAGDGSAVAAYWREMLPVARAVFAERGITAGDPVYAAAVDAALAPFGLAGWGSLLADGWREIAPEVSNDGFYRGTAAGDEIYIRTGSAAVYGGDGDDQLFVDEARSYGTILSGDGGADTLSGGNNRDWLDGGSGDDLMFGGGGDDTYVVDRAGDMVVEVEGAGEDTVRAAVDFVLGAGLEHLVLTDAALSGTGNMAANRITGNAAANVLIGLDGDDLLDGGTGADRMVGGAGRDTYYLDQSSDVIVEAGWDTDLVRSSISLKLGKFLEDLELLGDGDLDATGNAAGNRLVGNAGNNRLDGQEGNDQMFGGAGDDTFIVDSSGDTAYENGDEGLDTVRSSANHQLSANIEHLVLTGKSHISGIGNDLANRLNGNAGDNTLDGGGGADQLIGSKGNDTYLVDDPRDRVVERSKGGTDTVQTWLADYILPEHVENLVLRVGWWDDGSARSGTGNALANYIEGGSGPNTLLGLEGDDWLAGREGTDLLNGGDGNDWIDGGAGADRMIGDLGDDRYVIDDEGDVVLEAADGGTDTIVSSLSIILRSNVENLELTGWSAIDGQGNALGNRIDGNASNNNLDGGAGNDILAGGTGDDTYTVDSRGDVVIEAENEGNDTVRASVSWVLDAEVEHLVLLGSAALSGSGNDAANWISGNAGVNLLRGRDGDDTLDGGAGADRMDGEAGRDTYYVDDVGDRVIEAGWEIDLVRASISYTLGELVEDLELQGEGNLTATGNELNNRLVGNAGANRIDGRAGNDQLWGGAGDDTFVVDDQSDEVYENADEGMDIVEASAGYQLRANVERLILIGTNDIWGTGNELANRLTGNAGDNTLDGGLGADQMIGGAGDDTYLVDDIGDRVIEQAGGGIESVYTTLSSYVLPDEVENLWLGWRDSWSARSGTGNGLANVIDGSDGEGTLRGMGGNDTIRGWGGNDTLDGGDGNDLLDGGAGADRMTGGSGDDRYIVDNAGDTTVEGADGGVDMVEANVSTILRANVEHLDLVGSGNIDGQGNALANRITGNAADNKLDGGGGDDILSGGLGNDTYTIDSVGDHVIETPGAGNDTVRASVDHALSWSVENLVLLGSAALFATGNAADNVIEGNAGNNVIIGRAGHDTLTGGAGADTFRYLSRSDSAGPEWMADVITDFSGRNGDRIDVSAIDAIGDTAANDGFAFIGEAAFTAAGQVRFSEQGDTRYLYFNTDTNTDTAEMVIMLTGVGRIETNDLIL